MFLNGDNVDVVFLEASNNLMKFMPDTSIGLTSCVGHGPNVVCGDETNRFLFVLNLLILGQNVRL